HDVEVSRRTAVRSGFALVGVADTRAILHPSGYLHIQRALMQQSSFAATLCAWIGDDLSGAAALRAGSCHAKEPLLVAHLPAAAASTARCRALIRRRAFAMAGLAGFKAADLHLLLHSEDRFLESQCQVLA